MAARKFLYVVAALVVLTLGSALAYRIWGQRMLGAVMVPSARFSEPNHLTRADYEKREMWFARPDISADNASLWRPPGVPASRPGPVAVFYIHPTSYMAPFNIARWNASLKDEESNETALRFVMTQSSAFNRVGRVWAPRYHQAHFGAFLVPDHNDAAKAVNAAYRDIRAAFRVFLAENPTGPIMVAGHSQGSLHLMRLMKNEIAGTETADRIVAAYLIGWPVSLTADIPAMGMAACEKPDQARCILSWQSFAEPADTSLVSEAYGKYPGLTGKKRDGTPMLCVNPITGAQDDEAPASSNLGTLAPIADGEGDLKLVPSAVGARCENGFLMIGDGPQIGPYVLPGNNYHVYDYALFWANIRKDAEKRLTTFLKQR